MDGFLAVIWIVRLLFLALLYLFLARVVRSLLGDIRAAAREPSSSLGRLIVLDSPSGEPAQGRSELRNAHDVVDGRAFAVHGYRF